MIRAPLAQILVVSSLLMTVSVLAISCGTLATPTFTPESPSSTFTVTVARRPTPIRSPTPSYTTYVVRTGDNLWSIANRLDTTVGAIMELNGITSTLIYSGTQLRIPRGDSAVLTLIITPTPSDTPTPRASTATQGSSTPTRAPGAAPLDEWKGVYIGMPADDVVTVWGDPVRTRMVGHDDEGVVVEWVHSDAKLIMKKWEIGGVFCYRVAEIRLR